MQETEIKILRLTTGEDIIASCIYDPSNNGIQVFNPMAVIVKRLPNSKQTMLLVSPWLPIEILEEDYAFIDLQNILTILNPSEQFKKYYSNSVTEYETALSKQDEDSEMSEFEYGDMGEDEDDEDNSRQESNYKLH
jgi:hypothetical protein